jgi:hypothetical protein
MKATILALSAALFVAVPVAPLAAQAATPITVGMQVTDANGGPVGTIIAIKGNNVGVKTDKHEALLPKASFTPANGKLLFGMTQAQLNAEIEKSLAAADAAVKVGASVKGLNGAPVGTIDSVEGDNLILALSSGKKVQVGKSGVRGNVDGTVTIGLTADQLEAQVQDSDPAPSANGQ